MLLPSATQRALVGLHAARAQVPVASLALPIATGRSAAAVAGVSGGLAVAAQLGLVWLFRREPSRPWISESPGFVAHQLIALVFMTFCTVIGGAAWLSTSAWTGDAASRFLLADGTTRFLAAMIFGELVMWDLPCAIWIKALRRPDSIIHHFAMAAVAFNAAWLAPVFYGVFYLGLIEFSTIPLNIHEYFAHAVRAAERNVIPSSASRANIARFRRLRDGWQVWIALLWIGWSGL